MSEKTFLGHWKACFDNAHIGAWDLERDRTLTIERVEQGMVRDMGGGDKQKRVPMLFFKGAQKPLILNKTNGKTIAKLYGPRVADWIGKRVTLFASKTTKGGEEVDCVRIKPSVPTVEKGDEK